MSETRSVRACKASAVNLYAPCQSSFVMLQILPNHRSRKAYACELNMYPPAPFATAMPKLTYNPTLVILTPGSLRFALVRNVLSWWW